ncbi:MAG TPA: hypothetical protein VFH78_03895 [Candidatus Thermoplasmatota archaeon]|nr:hypothetical protein [Candidatus Thermoplasmatota archaeon]
MRSLQVLRHEARVRCSLCGASLFTVRDTRFGLTPPAVLCRACTSRAFQGSD